MILTERIQLFLNNVVATTLNTGDVVFMHLWNSSSTANPNRVFYVGDPTSSVARSALDYGLGIKCMNVNPIPNQPCDGLLANPALNVTAGTLNDSITGGCNCAVCDDAALTPQPAQTLLRSGDVVLYLQNGRNITNFALKYNSAKLIAGIEMFSASTLGNTSGNWTAVGVDVVVLWSGLRIAASRRMTAREKDNQYVQGAFQNAFANLLLRAQTQGGGTGLDWGILFYTEEVALTTDMTTSQRVSGREEDVDLHK